MGIDGRVAELMAGRVAEAEERVVPPLWGPESPAEASIVSDEAALVDRVREGDLDAFEALYDHHHARVLRMALHRGCPEPEAEDVMHEVFMVLWRKPPRLKVPLSTWLYRVVANKVASLHRRRRHRRAYVIAKQDELSAPDAGAPLEARDAVNAVLARMSDKKREVLVLYEIEERTGPEIAEAIGCSVGTVWTRLHHARIEFVRIARRLGVLEGAG